MKLRILLPILFLLPALLHADDTVIGYGPQGPVSRAEVPYVDFQQVNRSQQETEWCWAASISNAFAYYGHPVSQKRIVERVYGGDENAPAMHAQRIAELLNTDWIDDNNKPFHSTLTAAYDAEAHHYGITNKVIIDNLQNNKPLLVCNTQHCMVLTEATYTPVSVLSLGVFDPWPWGPETHDLPAAEIIPKERGGQLTFLGAFSITEGSRAQVPTRSIAGKGAPDAADSTDESGWDEVDYASESSLNVDVGAPNWGNKRSGNVTVRLETHNYSDDYEYKLIIKLCVVSSDRKTREHLEEIDSKTATILLAPNATKTQVFHLRWLTDSWKPSDSEMPSFDFPSENDGYSELHVFKKKI